VELYFFTMWATSLKFLSISMFLASSSPFFKDPDSAVLPPGLKAGGMNLHWKYILEEKIYYSVSQKPRRLVYKTRLGTSNKLATL